MITPIAIIHAVANAYGLKVHDLTGHGRHKRISEARHVCMWLLRERCRLSYPEIGRLMHKDHSTCIDGIRRIGKKMVSDAAFSRDVGPVLASLDVSLPYVVSIHAPGTGFRVAS